MKNILIVLLWILFTVVPVYGQGRIVLASDTENMFLKLPVTVEFVHPNGEKGWYFRGLNSENDGTYDLRKYYAFRMAVKCKKGALVNLHCVLWRDTIKEDRHNLMNSTSVSVIVKGTGEWQEVVIPITSFDYNKGQSYFLKFIKRIVVTIDGSSEKVQWKDASFIKAHSLALETDVYSRPLDTSFQTEYKVKVTNTSTTSQSVMLSIRREGWEGMKANVTPSSLFWNRMNQLL